MRSKEVRPDACSSQRPREKVNTTTGNCARVRREARRDRYTPRSCGRHREGRMESPWGPQCREEDQGQAQESSALQPQALVQENKVKQASPGQGPLGAWAAWPQRSGHVYSSSPSWPPQQHSTWERQQSKLHLVAPLPPAYVPCHDEVSLPLCVESTSGVQQQEEFPLSLRAIPCEKKMFQGDRTGHCADHIDLASFQSPAGREDCGIKDKDAGRSPHLTALPIPASPQLF